MAARRSESRRERANHRAFGITLREKRDLERAASDSKLGITGARDRTAPIKEGWLKVLNPPEKRGGVDEFTLHHKTPIKSYVVLDRKSLVCYPNQPSDEAIQAERHRESVLPKLKVITIGSGYIVTDEDGINVANLPHAFRVSNGRRAAIFSSTTPEEKASWVAAIEEAARRISTGETPTRNTSDMDHRDRMLEESGNVDESRETWLDRLARREAEGEDVDLLRFYAMFPGLDKKIIQDVWKDSGKNQRVALRSLKLMADPVPLDKNGEDSSSDPDSGDELLGKYRRDARKHLRRQKSEPGGFVHGRLDWQHRIKGLVDEASDDELDRPAPAGDTMRGPLRMGPNGFTTHAGNRSKADEPSQRKWREEVKMLVEMGFEEGKVLVALDDCLGDVNEALNHLGLDGSASTADRRERPPPQPSDFKNQASDDGFPEYREEDFKHGGSNDFKNQASDDGFPEYREEDFKHGDSDDGFPAYDEEEFNAAAPSLRGGMSNHAYPVGASTQGDLVSHGIDFSPSQSATSNDGLHRQGSQGALLTNAQTQQTEVDMLIEMGFGRAQAEFALQNAHGDFDAAVNALLS